MVQITPLLNALAAISQASPVARDVSPNALAARQVDTSSLPAQCQTSCQVINTMTDCSSSLTCICTSTIGSELQSCMSCLTEADPSVQTDAQSSLDSWNQACGGSLSLTGGSTGGSTSSSIAGSTGGSTSSVVIGGTHTSSIGSVATVTSGSTATTSSSSSSNPLTGKTGGAVGFKAASGAFGLAVVIACGILIL